MIKDSLDIIRKIQSHNYEAYYVGGCVRDALLLKEPKDLDIATSATPDELKEIFPNCKLVGECFGVICVKTEDDGDVEIATFRTDGKYSDGRRPNEVLYTRSLDEDAERRDFTINALYSNPLKGQCKDLFGGNEDLKNKLIRFIGNPDERIKEDHLRMMRACRFSAQLNFMIEEYSLDAIKRNSKLIDKIAPERIQTELNKLLLSDQPIYGINNLVYTGLLGRILPEVYCLLFEKQNPKYHPEGDVLTHTLLVIGYLIGEPLELILAGLFHDVGKPNTHSVEDDVIRHKRHDKEGAEITEKILKRLRYSNDIIEKVVWLVKNHMKIWQVDKMKKSTFRKFASHKWFDDLVTLMEADNNARPPKEPGDIRSIIEEKKKKYDLENYTPEELKPSCILTGMDLIHLGYKPGPLFGKILDSVFEAQLNDKFKSKEDAIKFVKNKF